MVPVKEPIAAMMSHNSLAVAAQEMPLVQQILKFRLAVPIERINTAAAAKRFAVEIVAQLGLIWSQLRFGQMSKLMSIMLLIDCVAKSSQ